MPIPAPKGWCQPWLPSSKAWPWSPSILTWGRRVCSTGYPRQMLLPNRGKENTVPGARIAKPVSRPKIPVEIGNVSPPGVLTSSSKVDGLQSSKSPNVISSKTVPHNKLLAKIKQNKR